MSEKERLEWEIARFDAMHPGAKDLSWSQMRRALIEKLDRIKKFPPDTET